MMLRFTDQKLQQGLEGIEKKLKVKDLTQYDLKRELMWLEEHDFQ